MRLSGIVRWIEDRSSERRSRESREVVERRLYVCEGRVGSIEVVVGDGGGDIGDEARGVIGEGDVLGESEG
jgi:hypothetical protein